MHRPVLPRKMFVALYLVLASFLIGPQIAYAEGWAGFYSSSNSGKPNQTPESRRIGADLVSGENNCVRAIFAAQQRYEIPDNLLLAIGLQEAGMARDSGLTVWPWSVNAAGEGRQFDDRQAALDWVRKRQSKGVKSIDIGCMQINLRWHPDAFSTLEEGFDPAVNVDYAARFLLSLKKRTGDWMGAAGSYHSFNPEPQAIYLTSMRRNLAVANARMAYFDQLAQAVPGTQTSSTPEARDIAEARPPTDGVAWSSWLTASHGRRSIYSNDDLQPILPVFYRQF